MADFLHRTTKVLELSKPESFAHADKIRNPNLAGLFNQITRTFLVPKRFWKIVGDVVSEMSPAEKTAVRATRLANRKTVKKAEIDAKTH